MLTASAGLASRSASVGQQRRGKKAIQYILYDEFTDVDGTLLTAHTMNRGSGWSTVFTPSPDIAGNAVRGTGTNSSARSNAGASNVTVVVNYLHVGAENNNGLFMRVTPATPTANHWRILYSGGTWSLVERAANVSTTRATGSLTPTSGQVYELKAVCSGDTITFFINGVQILTYASASFNNTETWFGFFIGSGGGTSSRIDNFRAYAS